MEKGSTVEFLSNLNNLAERFMIIGLDRYTIPKNKLIGGRLAINGKPKYARVLIRAK